ncbi:MAG: hypothetical protein H0V17_09505, partial [Deltaproteobacteria bacterium]|nr:hypothetical protein [Deltaproteobacteria bacterium]
PHLRNHESTQRPPGAAGHDITRDLRGMEGQGAMPRGSEAELGPGVWPDRPKRGSEGVLTRGALPDHAIAGRRYDDPAARTQLAPPEKTRSRWPVVVAIVLSATLATTITLLAVRSSSESPSTSPPLDQPAGSAIAQGSGSNIPAGPANVPPIIVGSGSAIDHGVHLGSNVTTGPNVIIGSQKRPPPATRLIDFDPSKFDPLAYLPKAKALARTIYPDAELTEFEFYENVLPDGSVDLTLKTSSSSYYEFRSPSHSVFPPTRNATNDDIPCYVMVDVTATGITARIREDDDCNHTLKAPPRCTFAQVWQLSRTKDTIPATVGFLHDGTWWFDHDHAGKRSGKATTTSFKDCR